MNPDEPQIIDYEEPAPKNRFPILVQLGVLVFIVAVAFRLMLWQTDDEKPPVVEQAFPTTNQEYPLIPQKITEVEVEAKAAYVWDVKAQRALFSKNSDQELPLASITKLMTTLLAYELIGEDVSATVSASAIQQEGSTGLLINEKLSAEELRELALVSSSNDAAYALAANVGELLGENDPTSQFIQAMNIRAGELGFETLQFWNTTGLDLSLTEPGAVGSARDISFLMEYIITEYPEIITATQQDTVRVYNSAGAYHEVDNTNEIVTEIPNLIGSKTGFTDLAGGNLTIAFDAGLNRPIIITVLGSTREERFTDVLKLVKAVQESLSK